MQKKKSLFNIVDITIIIVLIAIVVGSFVKSAQGKKNAELHDTQPIQYTLRIENTDLKLHNILKSGDTLYLAENNLPCGKLLSAPEKSDAVNYVVNTDTSEPRVQRIYNVHKYDITLNVAGEALVNNNGFMICKNEYIAPGKKLKLYTEKTSFECVVTSVKTAE